MLQDVAEAGIIDVSKAINNQSQGIHYMMVLGQAADLAAHVLKEAEPSMCHRAQLQAVPVRKALGVMNLHSGCMGLSSCTSHKRKKIGTTNE